MAQSFRALLAEQDEEFVFHIKSTRHLHDDDIFDRLRIGMLGYDLRKMEREKYDPLAAVEPMFRPRNDPAGLDKIYHVKVTLGTDVDSAVLRQKVAYFTDINWEYIVVHKDGERPDDIADVDLEVDEPDSRYKSLALHAKNWDGTPDEGDVDTDAQKYVAQKRIDDFMKELDTDRKEREKEAEGHLVQPRLTEAFVTTHLALFDALGHNAPKGYYLIERFQNDPSLMHIGGPFTHQPENYAFVSDLQVKGAGNFVAINESTVRMEEHDRDFRFTRPLRERMTPKPYEVSVQDQDSGKIYHVVVKAISETEAREEGVETVARQNQLDANRLIAVEPDSISA